MMLPCQMYSVWKDCHWLLSGLISGKKMCLK
jgi:hypothetical protein